MRLRQELDRLKDPYRTSAEQLSYETQREMGATSRSQRRKERAERKAIFGAKAVAFVTLSALWFSTLVVLTGSIPAGFAIMMASIIVTARAAKGRLLTGKEDGRSLEALEMLARPGADDRELRKELLASLSTDEDELERGLTRLEGEGKVIDPRFGQKMRQYIQALGHRGDMYLGDTEFGESPILLRGTSQEEIDRLGEEIVDLYSRPGSQEPGEPHQQTEDGVSRGSRRPGTRVRAAQADQKIRADQVEEEEEEPARDEERSRRRG